MQHIQLDITDHVAVVTMNAPPVNAVSAALMDEMIATFDRMSDLDEVRVVVLTGAGKMFCAGADIKSRAGLKMEPGDRWSHSRRARELSYSIIECKKPVLAAINGPALGAGLGITVSCDILLCSENASLGLPEVDVGLMGGGRHAMRVCGHALTRRMMMTAEQSRSNDSKEAMRAFVEKRPPQLLGHLIPGNRGLNAQAGEGATTG